GSIANAVSSLSVRRPPGARSTSARRRSISSGGRLPGSIGWQRKQGRYPLSSASLELAKKSTFCRAGFFAVQVGRQKIPVVRTPAKKMPSKLESRFTSARYIVSDEGRSSGAFICVRSEKYNNRGSRCARPQRQSRDFAATFQSPLQVDCR